MAQVPPNLERPGNWRKGNYGNGCYSHVINWINEYDKLLESINS